MNAHQIADLMENDPPDFRQLYSDEAVAQHERTWNTAISVIRTLGNDEDFVDWTQLPEAKEPE